MFCIGEAARCEADEGGRGGAIWLGKLDKGLGAVTAPGGGGAIMLPLTLPPGVGACVGLGDGAVG